jgi:AGCS family alanine or glycine:cation symporter
MAFIISLVIFGGIRRIGVVTAKLVPSMVIIYMIFGIIILMTNWRSIDNIFISIIKDAFTGEAVLGGSIGAVIITGIRRAAFSNEAGIGTEAMAHGAAITKEPIREGLVAMLGPMIDTLIVCSITGFVILSTGAWIDPNLNGISMTTKAFEIGLPIIGKPILIFIVFIFSITTMIGYSYYGSKCAVFLFGINWKQPYRIFYTLSLIVGSIVTIDLVINFIDGMFALMAIPTMISSIILSPKVMQAAKKYFSKLDNFSKI